MNNALPLMSFVSRAPQYRLSMLLYRLSPIMKMWPSGTTNIFGIPAQGHEWLRLLRTKADWSCRVRGGGQFSGSVQEGTQE